MAHCDTQIISAMAARLVSMTEVADSDVHDEHIWDFTNTELPAMDITCDGSEVLTDEEDATLGNMVTVRSEFVVTHYAKQSTSVGNKLREMAAEAQAKLIPSANDTKLGGLVTQFEYLGYVLVLSDEEEKPIGRLAQTYAAAYRMLVHEPETIQS